MRRICNIVIDLLDIVPGFWQGTICYKSALFFSGAVCAVMSGRNFLSFTGCYPKITFLGGAVWSEITGAVCSEFTGAVCSVIVNKYPNFCNQYFCYIFEAINIRSSGLRIYSVPFIRR
jgi:hypothetical protein